MKLLGVGEDSVRREDRVRPFRSPWRALGESLVAASTPRGGNRHASGSDGQDVLQLVEAVRPTVAVKRKTRLGLERALGEGDLRRFSEIPERGPTTVSTSSGSGSSQTKLNARRAGRSARGTRRPDRSGRPPAAASRSSRPSDARLEPQARNGEALRPPPLRELRRVAEGAEHDRTRGGKHARQGEGCSPDGVGTRCPIKRSPPCRSPSRGPPPSNRWHGCASCSTESARSGR